MSDQLYVWDPRRHAPLPASAEEALETLNRLSAVSDTKNATLEKFGIALVHCYQAGLSDALTQEGIEAFRGSDPREGTSVCRTAVYRLSIPLDKCTPQVSGAVTAAAGCGLVVVDDETGVCFLPDGTIFPEDMREMWESTFAAAEGCGRALRRHRPRRQAPVVACALEAERSTGALFG